MYAMKTVGEIEPQMKAETKQLDNISEAIIEKIYFSNKSMFSLRNIGSSSVTSPALSSHFPLPNIKF